MDESWSLGGRKQGGRCSLQVTAAEDDDRPSSAAENAETRKALVNFIGLVPADSPWEALDLGGNEHDL